MLPLNLYPIKPHCIFLDSLDTVRYSEDFQIREARISSSILHAKLDVVCTLLSGNIVTVSEPQLFDSLGFLSLFSELIDAIMEVKNETHKKRGIKLPIRISLRNSGGNVWKTVAKLLRQTKGSTIYFKLSGWPTLDLDNERREKWAEALEEGKRVKAEYILDEESPWYDKLDKLLKYIDYPEVNCYGQVEAAQIPDKYEAEMDQIALLDEETIMKMSYPQPDPANPLLSQPIWFRTDEEAYAALLIAEIVKLLKVKYQTLPVRTIVYDANLDRKTISSIEDVLKMSNFTQFLKYGISPIRHGLLELADGIYNEVVGISSRSHLIGNSRFRDPSGLFANAANSLVRWARETNNINNRGFSFSIPWGLIVEDKLEPSKNIKISASVSHSLMNLDWRVLLKTIMDIEWQTSIIEVKKQLEAWQILEKDIYDCLETSVNDLRLQKKVEEAKSKFDVNWNYHMRLTETLLKKYGHVISLENPLEQVDMKAIVGIPGLLSLELNKKVFINQFDIQNKQHNNEISSLLSQITSQILNAVISPSNEDRLE